MIKKKKKRLKLFAEKLLSFKLPRSQPQQYLMQIFFRV